MKHLKRQQQSLHIDHQSWKQALFSNNADRPGEMVHCSLFAFLCLDCAQYVPSLQCYVDDCSSASTYGHTIHRTQCGTGSCQGQRCSKFQQPANRESAFKTTCLSSSFNDRQTVCNNINHLLEMRRWLHQISL